MRGKRKVLWSLHYKMALIILVVFSIPFLLLLTINLHQIRIESEKQALFSAEKVLDETKDYIAFKTRSITEILNLIAFNDTVQASLIADSSRYEDINLWYQDANALSNAMNQFRFNSDIQTFQLYMESGLAGQPDNFDYLKMEELEKLDWFMPFLSSSDAFDWLPTRSFNYDVDNQGISVIRKIPAMHNIQTISGIIKVRLYADAFRSVLDHALLTPNSSVILFNERLESLGSSITSQLNEKDFMNVISNHREEWLSYPNNYQDEHFIINDNRMFLGLRSIPLTNMKIALIVPYSDILSASNKARDQMIKLYLLAIPLVFLLSYIAAGTMTKRIRKLTHLVRKMKSGDFKVADLPVNGDEIGELTENFNLMVKNISHLMDETYLLGREVKNKELMALQAQINPHFLYNTLDLINIMALTNNPNEITELVQRMATFYKLSLSNGKEKVTLENELRHIEAYAAIQNMRFGDKIKLAIRVSSEFFPYEVPKIMLQPLVENAIIHGLLENESGSGTIEISAYIEVQDLIIIVEDDGVGMASSETESLLHGTRSKNTGGFGLRNIQERIQLMYGQKYGMVFVSQPDQGMKVILRLPLILTEDDERN